MADAELGLIEAERALLSSAWLDGDRELVMKMHEKDFVDKFNRWLLSALQAIVAAGEPLDAVALARRIRTDKKAPSDAHAEAYQLLRESPTTAHKDYYFRTVRMERGRRFVHSMCDSAKQRDLRNPNEPLETIQWLRDCADEGIRQLSSLTEGSDPCTTTASTPKTPPATGTSCVTPNRQPTLR
jgi:replicative DNA helicase